MEASDVLAFLFLTKKPDPTQSSKATCRHLSGGFSIHIIIEGIAPVEAFHTQFGDAAAGIRF